MRMVEEGAITIGIEKVSFISKLIALVPLIIKIFVLFLIVIVIYFIYQVLKKRRMEKDIVIAATQRTSETISKREVKKRKKKRKINIKKTEEEIQKVEEQFEIPAEIEKHLKENERVIINILKQREGKAEQGTIRVVSGFPKATLSRILKELEERNIIYREKRGKKNLVFLKK